ncbi:MAG: hypothetical protein ACUVQY_09410 [Thermoproteota archaeon]
MNGQLQQQENFLASPINAQTAEDLLYYLRNRLDNVCEKIAERFSLYDVRGRPRKAYIVDVLTRYVCPCCAFRALTQSPERFEVDVLFRENHDLAVNLLVHALSSALKGGNSLSVQGEVSGEYGRLDVLVTRLSGGLLLVSSGTAEVIVEVKTNMSFSLKQVLRYLLERPSVTAIVWRVRKRHMLVIDGRRYRHLITLFATAAIQQGLAILNGEFKECGHNQPKNTPYMVHNPQEILDDFLTCMVEELPKVVNMVLGILKGRNTTNNGLRGDGREAQHQRTRETCS